MSKTRIKKKRSKAYSGADAANRQPVVHKYTAVQRSAFGEWWHEKGRFIKIVTSIVGILAFLIWLIFEAVRAVF